MNARICYLGDDHLAGAAAYLAGIMSHFGLAYDYVPSDESPPAVVRHGALCPLRGQRLPGGRGSRRPTWPTSAECVTAGSGLLMLGGWESFFGRLGEYHQSPLAEVLPVGCWPSDDRRNCAQPCLVRQGRRASDPRRAALGDAARHRRVQCRHAETRRGDALTARAVLGRVGRRRVVRVHRGRANRRCLVVGTHGQRPHRRPGHRRGPALGRRLGRLGRSANRPGSGRRVRSRSATGTPSSSATSWSGRDGWREIRLAIGCQPSAFSMSRRQRESWRCRLADR